MLNSQNNASVFTKLTTDENGNLALDFPEEIIRCLDWKEGDTLGIEVFAGRVIFRRIDGTGEDSFGT